MDPRKPADNPAANQVTTADVQQEVVTTNNLRDAIGQVVDDIIIRAEGTFTPPPVKQE